jgi:aminomethyltransferase
MPLETAFHGRAQAAGATFTEYEGYWLPSAFGGFDDEYWACRQRVVVMDLTPLRKFEVGGPGSAALLQAVVTRDLSTLVDGQVAYTAMCNDEGGVVDDGTVFRFGPEGYRWVGYVDEDRDWLEGQALRLGLSVQVEPCTDRLHNLAVQGPASRDVVSGLFWTGPGTPKVGDLSWFRFTEARLGGESGPSVLVSRTGYSGELGYELWCHPDDGPAVWDAVWEAGQPHGIRGLGLDALDPIRIEAGLIFRGYEYEPGREDPFEAGIGFTVSRSKKDDYVGKQALERRRAQPRQALVGLDVQGEQPPESGGAVSSDGSKVGVVTSACRSPVLGKTIALARVAAERRELGTRLSVAVGEGEAEATVVRFPFYDPDKSRPRS